MALDKGSLKPTLKNLLLNKISKTTIFECLTVEGEVINENAEIARSMNKFFCVVGRNLSAKIPKHPSPLLSEECKINECSEQPAEFTFHAVDTVAIYRALWEMKKSFEFGSDGIASNFLNIAYPVISNYICDIFIFSMFSGSFPDSWKIALWLQYSKEASVMTDQLTDRFLFYQSCQDSSKNLHTFISI